MYFTDFVCCHGLSKDPSATGSYGIKEIYRFIKGCEGQQEPSVSSPGANVANGS